MDIRSGKDKWQGTAWILERTMRDYFSAVDPSVMTR
jgi:hypothetical protein